MKGLVALITGGASGLGKGTAQYLSKQGARIALLDLPASNGEFISKIIGNGCLFVPANIAKESDVKNAFKVIDKSFGRLDAVINCAGISMHRKMFSFKRNESQNKTDIAPALNKIFEVNVLGLLNVIKCAIDLMNKNEESKLGYRGVIINTSSFSAFEPQFGQLIDACSSGAVNSLTKSLATQYAKDGIRFVAVAPGIFRTHLITSHMTEQSVKYYENIIQFPARLGMPEEFAALIHQILKNEVIREQVIRLDGALRMNI